MIIKGLIDEDFVNYKYSSMIISFPKCTFKCEKECGKQVCQNGTLVTSPDIEISEKEIVNRYLNNNLTHAIVMAGLEPFDTFLDLLSLIAEFRKKTNDNIIIFTGYFKSEIINEILILSQYKNIIIKFGRYIPGQEKHYDEILGVYLASDDQYAERIC